MVRLNKKKLCESCFAEIGSEPCPVCGYDSRNVHPDPAALPCGSILMGRYIIGMVIGRGGFGITYTAYDKNTEKKIAIKEFFPSGLANRLSVDPTVVVSTAEDAAVFKNGAEKFYNEAKLVSNFNGNPGIVKVYDFFYENDTVYFSMEYINGKSLKAHLHENGALSAEQAVFIADSVSTALLAAHSINVLHRDISPDNIMLCDDGSVKLIDFGAARQIIAEGSQSLSVIIKQGFAPIEQYQRKGKQGPWTDIYSLGATLYYSLTLDIISDPMSRLDDDELFLSNSHNIREDMWEVIVKATQIRAADRYADIFMFRNALAQTGIAPKPIPVTASRPEPVTFTNIRTAQAVTVPLSAYKTGKTAAVKPRNKKKLAAIAGAAAVLAAIIIPIGISRGNSDGLVTESSQTTVTASQTTTAATTAAPAVTAPPPTETTAKKTTTAAPAVTAPPPTETSATKTTTTAKTTAAPAVTNPPPQTTAAPKTTAAEAIPKEVKIGYKTYDTSMSGRLDLFNQALTNSDIVNLKYMTNITEIMLGLNNISDLSSLSNLTKLEKLYLGYNNISDLSPLSNLTKLEIVYIFDNNVSDISPLSKLTNLKELDLRGNSISNVSSLSKLTNLEYLNLCNNSISDISSLSKLTKLEKLVLENNNISNISPLSKLTNLTELDLNYNHSIPDLSPLSKLTKLETLELNQNDISDLSPLSGLTNLTTLSLWCNNISDISPLSKLTKLKKLELGSNKIPDISALKNLTKLEEIDISSYGDRRFIITVEDLEKYLSSQ